MKKLIEIRCVRFENLTKNNNMLSEILTINIAKCGNKDIK